MKPSEVLASASGPIVHGPIESAMHEKLMLAFKPVYLELENESHQHGGHRGNPGECATAVAETHFRLLMVSDKFNGIPRIGRQRLVHDCLKVELQPGAVHALTQRLLAPGEWSEEVKSNFTSPACLGGSKHEHS